MMVLIDVWNLITDDFFVTFFYFLLPSRFSSDQRHMDV